MLFSFRKYILILLFQFCAIANAQETITISVSEWLKQIEDKFGMSFSYSNTLWDNIEVQVPFENADFKTTLEILQEVAPLKIEESAGVYLVVPVRKEARFTVTDEITNDPIYLLTIRINNGNRYSYLSDESGFFTVKELFPTDTLELESIFYLSKKIAAKELFKNNVELQLTPDSKLLQEVTITDYMTEGIENNLNDHSIRIHLSELSTLAGESDGDVFQVLKALPGISAPNGKPGNVIMRGSLFSSNLILFDNIPVYHTGHLFGTLSPYNPDVIDQIEVYRNGVPVEVGGRVGGLIDLKTTEKIPDSLQAGIVSNTVFGAGYLKVPLLKNKLAIIASGRSSYPFQFLSPKLKAMTVLNAQGSNFYGALTSNSSNVKLDQLIQVFNDANLKLLFSPGAKQKFSISTLHIMNNFKYGLNSIDQGRNESTNVRLINRGATGNWTSRWKDNFSTEMNISASLFNIKELNVDETNGIYSKNDLSTNQVIDVNADYKALYAPFKSNRITLGYNIRSQNVQFSEQKNDSVSTIIKIENHKAVTNALYTNYQLLIEDDWIFNLGCRVSNYDLVNNYYVDPRGTFTWFVNKHLFLKGSVSRMHQFISQRFSNDFDDFKVSNQFWKLAMSSSDIMVGDQAMTGFVYTKSKWTTDLEVYTKKTSNIQKYSLNGSAKQGQLLSIGADLLFKRKFNKIDAWVAYSVSRSTLNFDTVSYAFYDQRHVLSLTTIVPYKRFTFSASWWWGSGLPVLPYTLQGPFASNPSLFVSKYTNRFPAQHQLDISVSCKVLQKSKKIKGLINLSVLNVYNKKNIVNQFYSISDPNNMLRYGIGIAPNLQVKIMW